MIETALTCRLGRDPELRRVRNGELALLSFSAIVEGRDEDPDNPRWVRVALFGEKAEALAGKLIKGTRVYVEGSLSSRRSRGVMVRREPGST